MLIVDFELLCGSIQTCNIPKLEMNATDVIKFFHDPRKINCIKGPNWVYIDEDKKIQLVDERWECLHSYIDNSEKRGAKRARDQVRFTGKMPNVKRRKFHSKRTLKIN